MKRLEANSHESYVVYVMIYVTFTSVELRNAPVCQAGTWHASPTHTWTKACDFFHTAAQCMLIRSVNGLYVHYIAHPMLLVFQEQHTALLCRMFPVRRCKGSTCLQSSAVLDLLWVGVLCVSSSSLSGLLL